MEQDNYAIAAFRSRQHVIWMGKLLRQAGIDTTLCSTPAAISLGCGVSVRFNQEHLPHAVAVFQRHAANTTLIGFYRVSRRNGHEHLQIYPSRL